MALGDPADYEERPEDVGGGQFLEQQPGGAFDAGRQP